MTREDARLPARTGTLTAGLVLGIAMLVSVIGSVITYRNASSTFAHHSEIDHAREAVASLLSWQLAESAALRGYVATGDARLLVPYYDAEPRFTESLGELRSTFNGENLSTAATLLTDIERAHQVWDRSLAQPVLAEAPASDLQKRLRPADDLIDRIRSDVSQLYIIIDGRASAINDEIQSLLLRAASYTAVLILLFGLAAIVADMLRSRTQVALERERTVTDTLQLVFLSAWDRLEYARIGTAYVSATREAAVGGDLYDVYRIDDERSILLVADVSGKGLASAVDTALVKYSIRMLAQDEPDPGRILEAFNRFYIRSATDLSAFVSIFLGVFDARTATIRYASAGHGPAYVRRDSQVWQLPATGPLVGLAPTDAFGTGSLQLGPEDTLVIATDGLPEARDSSGMMLDDERVMRWIAEGSPDPQPLADELVAKLGRFSGGRISDDLALLIVRLAESPAAEQPAQRPTAVGQPEGPAAVGQPDGTTGRPAAASSGL